MLVGTVASLSTFVLFYLMTVFALSWGTTKLGYARDQFLWVQMIGVVCFALFIPLAARIAQWRGARAAMLLATALIFVFGLLFAPLFVAGTLGGTLLFMVLGMCLVGLTYGPVGTLLAQLFPDCRCAIPARRWHSTCRASSAHRSRPTSRCGWPGTTGLRPSVTTCPPQPR